MSGSAQSSAQKDANKQLNRGENVAYAARNALLEDPLFAMLRQNVEQRVANPYTFGPAEREAMFRNQAAIANQAANDFLTNASERATVTSGYRSGPMQQQRILAASGLGEGLAEAQRQVALTGAQQDRQDEIQSAEAAKSFLDFRNSIDRNLAALHMGAGQTFAGYAPEQTTLTGALGRGFASSLGSTLGNPVGAMKGPTGGSSTGEGAGGGGGGGILGMMK